ncbi:MAG: sigma 54-interacting transcriptional regulator [Candidatus Solibacter sp.]
MPSAASQQQTTWLIENGPRELEALLRAIVYHPSTPILLADNDRHSLDASSGAGKLLGLPREEIIGRSLDDFADPAFRPQMSELWQAFLERGKQEGTLSLVGPDGKSRQVGYTVKGNVLPVRHLLLLHDKHGDAQSSRGEIPTWVQDYAIFLLNVDGTVVAWYSGAERIYGYAASEVLNQHISVLYPADEAQRSYVTEELNRSIAEGHFGNEGWCMRQDGDRFWGNVVTVALRDGNGKLQGFARVVRDFSERRERDERLRAKRSRLRPISTDTLIAGIVSGEFDRIPEANDAFLELVGYTREDLLAGRLQWSDLTPPEYFALDELAHEEGLRFGACTPFEKELIRKDGSRVQVLVASAVLKLSPFRWITFVQELSAFDRQLAGEETGESEDEVVVLKNDFVEIVGRSAAMNRVLGQIELVSPTNATVLILGETGTGKELVARAVHQMSPRRDRPFVTLNCAAIPTGLLESELFGYERGAFTGALSQKIGRFEMANRGTLFLDEVGDIPLDLQPKLLRALQEKAFERLGGTKTIPIDVRLVAATNRNLTQMMGDKLFRSDLYYRLKVFPITTSPLRDHPEDIPTLARHFVQKYAREMGKQIDTIPTDALQALVKWSWPGNVRELENFIERAVILTQGSSLRAPLAEIRPDAAEAPGDSTLEFVERAHLLRILGETGWVVSKAAARLGMPRTTLNAMMAKLGISRKDA